MSPNFLNIHKYCLLLIFSNVRIQDIPSLLLTCKSIKDMFSNDLIWENLAKKDFKQNLYMDRDNFDTAKDMYKYHYMLCHTCNRNLKEFGLKRRFCSKCNKVMCNNCESKVEGETDTYCNVCTVVIHKMPVSFNFDFEEDSIFESARKQIEGNNKDQATKILCNLISKNHFSPRYLNERACVYNSIGEYQLAIKDYDAAILIDKSDNVMYRSNRLRSNQALAKFDQCKIDANFILETYKDVTSPWHSLCKSRALASELKIKEALGELTKGINSKTFYQFMYVLYYDRARMKSMLSNFSEALEDLVVSSNDSKITNSGWLGAINLEMCTCEFAMGNYAKSFSYLKKAKENGTREDNLNLVSFLVYYGTGNKVEAINYLNLLPKPFLVAAFKSNLHYLNVNHSHKVFYKIVTYLLECKPFLKQYVSYGHFLHNKEF